VKDRVSFVKELWDQSWFFFKTPESYDAKVVKKAWRDTTSGIMSELISVLKIIDDFSSENTEEKVKQWATSKSYGLGQVLSPMRLMVVGGSIGPHIFDIISLLGKTETIRRMEVAILEIPKNQQ
jgi:glutamyl-tRNA synthetase